MNNEKNPTMIGSLQVGFGIIDIIASQSQPLKFTEIQELSQITKSNLYKYLNTFTYLELLYKDKQTGSLYTWSKNDRIWYGSNWTTRPHNTGHTIPSRK